MPPLEAIVFKPLLSRPNIFILYSPAVQARFLYCFGGVSFVILICLGSVHEDPR